MKRTALTMIASLMVMSSMSFADTDGKTEMSGFAQPSKTGMKDYILNATLAFNEGSIDACNTMRTTVKHIDVDRMKSDSEYKRGVSYGTNLCTNSI